MTTWVMRITAYRRQLPATELTYSLSGSDAGSFRVRNNNDNGQIDGGSGREPEL